MDCALPQDKVHQVADHISDHLSCNLRELRRLFLVEDLVDSIKVYPTMNEIHIVAASKSYKAYRNKIINYYRPQRSCGKVMFSQACVKNSVHGGGGHAWQGMPHWQILRDTVNERAVRILLECVLVTRN